jgi:regulator of sirC expression with transglutaminase-like and TPR domain
VPATVVGMPGHVLIGDGGTEGRPRRWVDGFHGGTWLDEAGARARFASLHGPQAPFDPTFLRALPDGAVVARLLANLVGIYATLGDGHRLVRVHELRAAIPGLGARERPQRAAALAAVGRYAEAADLWETEAATRSGPEALAAQAQVRLLRANLN